MPKIPDIQYQTRPVGPTNQPRMSAEALAAPGAGLQQFGRTMQQSAQVFNEIKLKQDDFEAELQYLEREQEVSEAYRKAKEDAPEGADGFAESVKTKFDESMPLFMENAPTSNAAQQKLQLKYTRLRGSLVNDALQFEAQAKTAQNIRRTEQATDQMANVARTEPHRIFEQIEAARDLVQSAPLGDEQKRAEVMRKVESKIYASGADGWVTQFETQPTTLAQLDEALATVKEGAYDFKGKLAPETYDNLLTRLENRKKVVAQENKQAVMYAFQDSIASIQTNGRDPGLVNRALLSKTFPDEPERVDRMIQQLGSEQRMFGMRMRSATTTPQEDAATLARLTQSATGEGAAIRRPELLEMQQVLRAKYAEWASDPRAYAVKNDPALAQLVSQAERTGDAQTGQMVVGKLDGWYDRMGTPTWARQYLGKGASQQMVAQLNSIGPEAASDEMFKLQNAYPKQYSHILRELDAAGLDTGFMVLGRMDSPSEAVGRKKLAEAQQVGRTELTKVIGEAAKTDIDNRVLDKMRDFNGTLSMAGTTGARIQAAEMTAMQNLSYKLMADSPGKSTREAVDTAYQMLHNTRDYGASYSTPKGMLGVMENAERQAMRQLQPEMFTPAAIPPTATPQQRAVYESPAGIEARRKAAYEAAKYQGRWVNSPDGNGIILMVPDDNTGTGYSPARMMDGNYYERKFIDVFNNPVPAPTDIPASISPDIGGTGYAEELLKQQ